MATLQMYMDRSRINNQYEDPSWKEVWGDGFGVDNSVGKIRKILVHCPGEEILQLSEGQYEEEAGTRILKDSRGRIRNYLKGHDLPNLQKLQEQHNRMTDLLRQEDIEVLSFDDPTHYWTNLVFTRDIALMTPRGAVICRPAMYFHAGEPKMTQAWMTSHGIPIVGVIQGTGTMEGGSFSMLDRHTAIIGRSVRINDEGIGQLRQLLGYQGIELIVLDLPASYIHLDEAFLPVDKDKILASTFILPFWFLHRLQEKGYQIIECDRDDPMLSNNCIALSPGKVLFSDKAPRTRANLEKAGVETITVDLSEINRLGGGIHCSTLPILRDSI